MQHTLTDYPLLLLCGGKSSRMGTSKGLLHINGTPWFQHHIERFKQFGGKNVVVVFGYDFPHYLNYLNCKRDITGSWLDRFGLNVGVVLNPNPQLGQFSSIQCGLEFINQHDFSASFVLPVDTPSPAESVWKALTSKRTTTKKVCVPSYYGKGGHPVLLVREFWDILTRLSPDLPESRLDKQIELLPEEEICYVNVDDPSILKNVNTPDEFGSM